MDIITIFFSTVYTNVTVFIICNVKQWTIMVMNNEHDDQVCGCTVLRRVLFSIVLETVQMPLLFAHTLCGLLRLLKSLLITQTA